MGWNEGRRQSSVNYFDGVLDPLKEAAKDTASRVKGLRLDNTGEAVKKAAGGIVDALGAVSGRLRRIDLMDDVQAKRKALQASASAELSRLRRIGWDSRGRVRQEETPREAQARLDYFKKLQLWRSQDARLAVMLPQGEGIVPQRGRMVARRGNQQTTAKRYQPQAEQVENTQERQAARSQTEQKKVYQEIKYVPSHDKQPTRYIPPQIAEKRKQSGVNATKEAEQAAKDERRDMADKASVQSALFLDDIRRNISRLVAILGQDVGGAGVPATPQ
jgi:hypothetical protein